MSDKERKKRKPTASEQAWQQRRAESLAAYNQRKAEREERRAANTDDPERAAAARRAAEMYRSRIPAADNGAAAPAAGRNPGGGNGAPVAGGNNADNAALKALRTDVAQLRAEVDRLRRIIGNLAGEGNLTPDSGLIEMDNSVPSHPVIRFRADRLPVGGGSDSVDVVVNVSYDTTTHNFKQYKRTISGIRLEPVTEAQEQGEIVFITTAHSAEP